MGHRGKHRRRHTSRAVAAARIAVGGLVLAEVTGGFSAIPASAAEPPVLARAHHHDDHAHHKVVHQPRRRVAAKPAAAVRAATIQAPAPQPEPAAPQDLFDHYTVQSGDTLTHIAAAYRIPWEALYAVNTDTVAHPDFIRVGQVLRLPV